ncbi:MAG: hypothetical protein Q9226_000832, partial [Calogaya cf. arnoldii]
ESLFQIDPDLLENYCAFDDENWVLLYKMPRFFGKKVYEARRKLGRDFREYLKLPVSQREEAAALITETESGCEF